MPNGKLVGDVGYAAAAGACGWITPVPGGLGMAVAVLSSNTVDAACARARALNPYTDQKRFLRRGLIVMSAKNLEEDAEGSR